MSVIVPENPVQEFDTCTNRPRVSSRNAEWRTWLAIAVCYAGWFTVTASGEVLGYLMYPLAAVLATFHSSLQHEALHGHPTRSANMNEALVFLPLSVAYPYRRFRSLHLQHHNNAHLTDPYDDPETWYVAERDYAQMSGVLRACLKINATLLGRLLLGPCLAVYGFLRAEMRLMLAGHRELARAWLHHVLGLALLFGWLSFMGVPILSYLLLVAYPALSLLMIRTYIEHRAETDPGHRSVIVDAEWPLALLFLNNNLHALHHDRPNLPWYRLPAAYRQERTKILAGNGTYHFDGYRSVFRKYCLRRRGPLIHPFLRREPKK